MKLTSKSLKNRAPWEAAGVALPKFDRDAMLAKTEKTPRWVHFGAGNIFRGFPAKLCQILLEKGLMDSGIVAAETFDMDIVDKIYAPCDSLTVLVSLMPDGEMKKEIIASVAKGLKVAPAYPEDLAELTAIFENPSLQMASFTITEKGYQLKNIDGDFFPFVAADFEAGPAACTHAMCRVTALLNARFHANRAPIAMVSMDNCSHNGEKLKNAVLTVAAEWEKRGFVSAEFVAWVSDEANVSFPWSMIDKITPRPAKAVEDALTALGIEDMAPVVTGKNTYIAPFVNAEAPQYLVIEDRFPAGRPALEEAGVYLTDRETVNKTETMKVTTCLNPLHTCLAVYGCLMGYDSIAAEMKDEELVKLITRVGFVEGLPVVVDPGILSPKAFITEVMEQRLPNPFIPDTPQRIATDTSQKMAIRFGETVKSYMADPALDPASLIAVPLAVAGWIRYLIQVGDDGKPMVCSPDPMLETLSKALSGVEFGKPETATEEILRPILENAALFGVNLYEAGLAEKVVCYVKQMLAGPGAIRETLKKAL